MEPLGHGAVRLPHRGDRGEHVAFSAGLALGAPTLSSRLRSFIAARSAPVNRFDCAVVCVPPFFAVFVSSFSQSRNST
jgi:hypothetical protein